MQSVNNGFVFTRSSRARLLSHTSTCVVRARSESASLRHAPSRFFSFFASTAPAFSLLLNVVRFYIHTTICNINKRHAVGAFCELKFVFGACARGSVSVMPLRNAKQSIALVTAPPNQALQGTSPNLQKQQRKFGAAPELGC